MIYLRGTCDNEECSPYIYKWADWWHVKRPNALLKVSGYPYDYFNTILDAKSRNMVRKCVSHEYTFRTYAFNDYLDDMTEINTSKPYRSGGPMTEAYTHPVEAIAHRDDCIQHRQHYLGAFWKGRLMAYCWLPIVGQLSIINRIIGHADALEHGVMNGLVYFIYNHCSFYAAPGYVCYLSVHPTAGGLDRFKRSVGFVPTNEYIDVSTVL